MSIQYPSPVSQDQHRLNLIKDRVIRKNMAISQRAKRKNHPCLDFKKLWDMVKENAEQGFYCEYCGCHLTIYNDNSQGNNRGFSLDHCIPLVRGGKNRVDNIAVCCQECNFKKLNLTDKEYRSLLSNPKLDPKTFHKTHEGYILCPYCNSFHIIKSGKRELKEGEAQKYFCKHCNRGFSQNNTYCGEQ